MDKINELKNARVRQILEFVHYNFENANSPQAQGMMQEVYSIQNQCNHTFDHPIGDHCTKCAYVMNGTLI